MSEHATESWEVYDHEYRVCVDGFLITTNHEWIGHPVIAYVPTHEGRDWKQAEEYSRLIAAAPRLLRELQHLVRLLEPIEKSGALDVPGLATLNGARAAIAEATASPGR